MDRRERELRQRERDADLDLLLSDPSYASELKLTRRDEIPPHRASRRGRRIGPGAGAAVALLVMAAGLYSSGRGDRWRILRGGADPVVCTDSASTPTVTAVPLVGDSTATLVSSAFASTCAGALHDSTRWWVTKDTGSLDDTLWLATSADSLLRYWPAGITGGASEWTTDDTLVVHAVHYPTIGAPSAPGVDTIIANVPTCDNEPVGFTQLASRDFDALQEEGWFDVTISGASVFVISNQFLAAPYSPPSTGVTLMTTAFTQGGSLAGPQALNHPAGTAEVYACFSILTTDPYDPHTNGDKFGYTTSGDAINGAGGPLFYGPVMSGDDMILRYTQQGFGSQNFLRNVGSVGDDVLTPAKVHLIEHHIVGNSAATADGELHVWLDGTKIIQVTGVQWSAEATDFGTCDDAACSTRWSGTWGGNSGLPNPPQQQGWIMDFAYVSTKAGA